jgi:hypothetical protein
LYGLVCFQALNKFFLDILSSSEMDSKIKPKRVDP